MSIQHEINYTDLIIGKQYICKCYTMTKKLTFREILYWEPLIFIKTNKPEYTFQVYPNNVVKFYEDTENTNVSNNFPCKILEPYTQCPISWEYFEDGDEIIIIDDTFIFSKEGLEKWLENKSINPLTNEVINESQLKYYTVITLSFID